LENARDLRSTDKPPIFDGGATRAPHAFNWLANSSSSQRG
jgi:hypothetical protein